MISSAWTGINKKLKCTLEKWEQNHQFTNGIQKDKKLKFIKEPKKGFLQYLLIQNTLLQLDLMMTTTFIYLMKIKES